MAGEEYGRLACTIASSDEGDLLTGTQVGFERRRPIVDGWTFKLLKAIDREPSIAGTSGDDHRTRLDPFAGRELDVARIVAALEFHGLVGDRDLDAEFLRLAECAAHQCHARNPGRKAEIILDPRGCAGLAPE